MCALCEQINQTPVMDLETFLSLISKPREEIKEPTTTKPKVKAYGQVSNRVAPPKATDLLSRAAGHMQDRAKTYDAPKGERSMGKTVAAFNELTGHKLTEEDGWIFMAILKMARITQGAYRSDNYEDLVAYAALLGEAAAKLG